MKKIICLLMTLVLCLAVGAGFAEPAEDIGVFGELDGAKYENAAMGIGCVFDGWNYHSQEEILATYNLVQSSSSEEVAEMLKNNTSIIVMYAESADQLQNVNLVLDSNAAPFVQAYGEDEYFQQLIQLYEQVAPGQGWNDFTSEVIERQIGGKTLKGLKNSYTMKGIQIYQTQLAWLDGEFVNIITATSYYSDNCDSITEHFYTLGE